MNQHSPLRPVPQPVLLKKNQCSVLLVLGGNDEEKYKHIKDIRHITTELLIVGANDMETRKKVLTALTSASNGLCRIGYLFAEPHHQRSYLPWLLDYLKRHRGITTVFILDGRQDMRYMRSTLRKHGEKYGYTQPIDVAPLQAAFDRKRYVIER